MTLWTSSWTCCRKYIFYLRSLFWRIDSTLRIFFLNKKMIWNTEIASIYNDFITTKSITTKHYIQINYVDLLPLGPKPIKSFYLASYTRRSRKLLSRPHIFFLGIDKSMTDRNGRSDTTDPPSVQWNGRRTKWF